MYTNSDSDHSMGNKDKTRDGDATTNRDHSHSRANRDHSRDRESRDAALAKTIAKAVALQTQSIAEMFAKQTREAAKETQSMAETFTRQMVKAHVQYQDLLKEVAQPPYQLPLKLLLQQMALE